MAKRIEIYGRNDCRFCAAAVALCDKAKLPFVYYNMSETPALFDDLADRLGVRDLTGKTVPQIFIGAHRIGGFDDLKRSLPVIQQILGGN